MKTEEKTAGYQAVEQDTFLKSLFNEDYLMSPSLNFTANIMAVVQQKESLALVKDYALNDQLKDYKTIIKNIRLYTLNLLFHNRFLGSILACNLALKILLALTDSFPPVRKYQMNHIKIKNNKNIRIYG